MFRIKIILIVVGGLLVFWGFREWRVSGGASSEPQVVDLAEFEQGKESSNPYIQVQEHSAVYAATVYEYEESRSSSGDPGATAKVNHAYYPIISMAHPFNVRWAELAEQYGDYDSVPETEDFPELNTFSVLVKTKRFKTVGAIPDGIVDESGVSGLLINTISGLDSEEEKLVGESFPSVDPTTC